MRSWMKAEHSMTTMFFIAWAASVLVLAGSHILSAWNLSATSAPVLALALGVACFFMVRAPATRKGSGEASRKKHTTAMAPCASPAHDGMWSRTVSWE